MSNVLYSDSSAIIDQLIKNPLNNNVLSGLFKSSTVINTENNTTLPTNKLFPDITPIDFSKFTSGNASFPTTTTSNIDFSKFSVANINPPDKLPSVNPTSTSIPKIDFSKFVPENNPQINGQSLASLFKDNFPVNSDFQLPAYGIETPNSSMNNNNNVIHNNVVANSPKDKSEPIISYDKLINNLHRLSPNSSRDTAPISSPFQQSNSTISSPFQQANFTVSNPFQQSNSTISKPSPMFRTSVTETQSTQQPSYQLPVSSINNPMFKNPIIETQSQFTQQSSYQLPVSSLNNPMFKESVIQTQTTTPFNPLPVSSLNNPMFKESIPEAIPQTLKVPQVIQKPINQEPITISASIRANDAPKDFKGEEDIVIHAYDWTEQDEYNPDGSSMTINCWGLGRNDEPYLLRINNMYISCFLELHPKVDGKLFNWDEYHMRKVCEYINKCMGVNKPEYLIPTYMKKLYYYRDNPKLGQNGIAKYPMIALVFRNDNQMKHCKNLMTNKPRFISEVGTITCNIWEADISSIRKMLTLRKMKYSQWFNTHGRRVPEHEKISRLKNEFYVDFKDINPIDPLESKSWVTHPRVFSLDIETYSDNKKALPVKTNPNHPAYLITIVYQRTGLPETRQRYAIFMGEYFKELEKDYKIIKVNTEVELCDKMCELIGELDPEILIGWNTFGYDYPYLDARLQMRNEEWSNKASRIIKKNPKLKSDNWTSSGYGLNEMNILLMEGRINIDQMMVVKRDYKLPRYNLDTAAWKFVKKHKNDVSAEQMFIYYEEMDIAIKLFNRIVEDYDDDGNPKFFDNISQDVIDQVALKLEKAMDNMEKVIDYGIQDSNLPMDIFDKINTWIGLIQLSNIVGVTVTEIFTRGQQIRGLSQLYDLAHDPKYNYVLDKKPASKIDWVGGFVNDPVAGLHEFVSCLDFKSLYPSIIIAFNICYTTFIPFELMDKIPDEMCNVIEWDEVPDDADEDDDDEDKENGTIDEDGIRKKAPKQITHYKYKFIKKEYKEGLLPVLVGNLISERRRVVGLIRNESDPVTRVVLDKTQLGLKISANSVFGMLGAETGKRPLVEAAMCITAMGRMLIEKANKILTEEYGMIILYNDTDSTFFKNPKCKSALEAIKEAHELEHIISARYPDPLYFEHEKSGRVLLLKKKKYAFWHYDLKTGELKDPEKDDEAILMRGIVLARRDNCQYQRKFYYDILYGVLQKKSRQQIMDIILREITRLYRHEVKWDDLTMIKGLGAHYKSDTYFMKVFSDELRRIGKPQAPGSRLDYLIVEDNRGETLLGKKMRLPETYLERKGTPEEEKVDVLYYIEKIVTNCIEQLWQIAFKDEIKELEPQHEWEDYMNIVNILMSDEKKGNYCRQIFHECGGNPMTTYSVLFGTKGFKGKCQDAYRMLRGMHAFVPRVSLNPIKMLKKAILLDRYQETIKALASKELYSELYPDDKTENVTVNTNYGNPIFSFNAGTTVNNTNVNNTDNVPQFDFGQSFGPTFDFQ